MKNTNKNREIILNNPFLFNWRTILILW